MTDAWPVGSRIRARVPSGVELGCDTRAEWRLQSDQVARASLDAAGAGEDDPQDGNVGVEQSKGTSVPVRPGGARGEAASLLHRAVVRGRARDGWLRVTFLGDAPRMVCVPACGVVADCVATDEAGKLESRLEAEREGERAVLLDAGVDLAAAPAVPVVTLLDSDTDSAAGPVWQAGDSERVAGNASEVDRLEQGGLGMDRFVAKHDGRRMVAERGGLARVEYDTWGVARRETVTGERTFSELGGDVNGAKGSYGRMKTSGSASVSSVEGRREDGIGAFDRGRSDARNAAQAATARKVPGGGFAVEYGTLAQADRSCKLSYRVPLRVAEADAPCSEPSLFDAAPHVHEDPQSPQMDPFGTNNGVDLGMDSRVARADFRVDLTARPYTTQRYADHSSFSRGGNANAVGSPSGVEGAYPREHRMGGVDSSTFHSAHASTPEERLRASSTRGSSEGISDSRGVLDVPIPRFDGDLRKTDTTFTRFGWSPQKKLGQESRKEAHIMYNYRGYEVEGWVQDQGWHASQLDEMESAEAAFRARDYEVDPDGVYNPCFPANLGASPNRYRVQDFGLQPWRRDEMVPTNGERGAYGYNELRGRSAIEGGGSRDNHGAGRAIAFCGENLLGCRQDNVHYQANDAAPEGRRPGLPGGLTVMGDQSSRVRDFSSRFPEQASSSVGGRDGVLVNHDGESSVVQEVVRSGTVRKLHLRSRSCTGLRVGRKSEHEEGATRRAVSRKRPRSPSKFPRGRLDQNNAGEAKLVDCVVLDADNGIDVLPVRARSVESPGRMTMETFAQERRGRLTVNGRQSHSSQRAWAEHMSPPFGNVQQGIGRCCNPFLAMKGPLQFSGSKGRVSHASGHALQCSGTEGHSLPRRRRFSDTATAASSAANGFRSRPASAFEPFSPLANLPSPEKRRVSEALAVDPLSLLPAAWPESWKASLEPRINSLRKSSSRASRKGSPIRKRVRLKALMTVPTARVPGPARVGSVGAACVQFAKNGRTGSRYPLARASSIAASIAGLDIVETFRHFSCVCGLQIDVAEGALQCALCRCWTHAICSGLRGAELARLVATDRPTGKCGGDAPGASGDGDRAEFVCVQCVADGGATDFDVCDATSFVVKGGGCGEEERRLTFSTGAFVGVCAGEFALAQRALQQHRPRTLPRSERARRRRGWDGWAALRVCAQGRGIVRGGKASELRRPRRAQPFDVQKRVENVERLLQGEDVKGRNDSKLDWLFRATRVVF